MFSFCHDHESYVTTHKTSLNAVLSACNDISELLTAVQEYI